MHVVRKHFTSHLLANATSLIVWGPGDGRTPTDDELATMQRDDLQPLKKSGRRWLGSWRALLRP